MTENNTCIVVNLQLTRLLSYTAGNNFFHKFSRNIFDEKNLETNTVHFYYHYNLLLCYDYNLLFCYLYDAHKNCCDVSVYTCTHARACMQAYL